MVAKNTAIGSVVKGREAGVEIFLSAVSSRLEKYYSFTP
jgi:hypothetical protein